MRTSRSAGRIFSPAALGFLLVFAFTAYAGARIVAFEELEGRMGGAIVASASGADQALRSAIDAISRWKTTSGVATPARVLTLGVLMREAPGDNAAIESALRELAESSPTSVATWQALVANQQARRAPREHVITAFRMSALTGSHEGYFMSQRAVFGLEHWTDMPETDRRVVIRDLLVSASQPRVFEIGSEQYRKIIASKSSAERDEIRAAIMVSGRGTKDLMQALGM